MSTIAVIDTGICNLRSVTKALETVGAEIRVVRSPAEIEAGRKLFAASWDFAAAVDTLERLPPMRGMEVAFAGRSNVGKSSLINALTGRKALARTSHTPGRTQELIYFTAPPPSPLRLVDMPGYGYAEAPKSTVKAWTALIHAYLSGRANLARVYVLIDARHGLKTADEAVLKTLDELTPHDRVTGRRAVTLKAIQFLDDDPSGLLRSIAEQHGDGPDSYTLKTIGDLQ